MHSAGREEDAGWRRSYGERDTRPGRRSHLLRQAGAGPGEVLHVGLGAALPVVHDEVRGHLALQAGDVAMAEVIAQVVHLREKKREKKSVTLIIVIA